MGVVWLSEGEEGVGGGEGLLGGVGGRLARGPRLWHSLAPLLLPPSSTPPTGSGGWGGWRGGWLFRLFTPVSLCFGFLCFLFLPRAGMLPVGPPAPFAPCSARSHIGSMPLGRLTAHPLCTRVERQPHSTTLTPQLQTSWVRQLQIAAITVAGALRQVKQQRYWLV